MLRDEAFIHYVWKEHDDGCQGTGGNGNRNFLSSKNSGLPGTVAHPLVAMDVLSHHNGIIHQHTDGKH